MESRNAHSLYMASSVFKKCKILSVDAPNKGALSLKINQRTQTELQREIGTSTVRVDYLKTPLSGTGRTRRQKIRF